MFSADDATLRRCRSHLFRHRPTNVGNVSRSGLSRGSSLWLDPASSRPSPAAALEKHTRPSDKRLGEHIRRSRTFKKVAALPQLAEFSELRGLDPFVRPQYGTTANRRQEALLSADQGIDASVTLRNARLRTRPVVTAKPSHWPAAFLCTATVPIGNGAEKTPRASGVSARFPLG